MIHGDAIQKRATRESVTEKWVDVTGSQLFVRQWSPATPSERRSPLLLLHESLGSVDLWRDFPRHLASATSRTVIAYDRLGFGKSTPRDGRPSMGFIADEAAIVHELVRQLEVDSVIPFGHSVGGLMAIHVAASGLVHCAGVITESSQAFIEPRTLEGVARAREQFADPQQLARLEKWHGDKARWVVDAWTETWLSPEFAGWSLDDVLPRVSCPVLAIHGDDDEFGSTEFARRIAAGAGQGQFVIIERCGHVPHREKEGAVLQAVSSFCAALP